MKDRPQRVILLMSDISGYTGFIMKKGKTLAHAQVLITELMKSIIDEIKIPLRIVEIEGDAVFFYGEESGTHSWEETVELISKKMTVFFEKFYSRMSDLKQSNMCHCEACDGISDLRLKMIVHSGDALKYDIEGLSKLSGLDVILVHRLLKNSVKGNEYILMTDQAFSEISKYLSVDFQKGTEKYEDLGEVNTYIHFPRLGDSALNGSLAKDKKASFMAKMGQTMKIGLLGMLVMFGLKRLPAFRNPPQRRGR